MKCPKCGRDCAPGAKFCAGCGGPLPSAPTPQPAPQPVPQPKPQPQPQPQPKAQPRPAPAAKPPKAKGGHGGIIALVVVLVLVAVLAVALFLVRGWMQSTLLSRAVDKLPTVCADAVKEEYGQLLDEGYTLEADPDDFQLDHDQGSVYDLTGAMTATTDSGETYQVEVVGTVTTDFLFLGCTPKVKVQCELPDAPPAVAELDPYTLEGTYYRDGSPDMTLEMKVLSGQLYVRMMTYGVTEVETLVDLPTSTSFSVPGSYGTVDLTFFPGDRSVTVTENGSTGFYTSTMEVPASAAPATATPAPATAPPVATEQPTSSDVLSLDGFNYTGNFTDPDGYILPTDTQYISESDLYQFTTRREMNLVYNEIFARHGHDFGRDWIRNYFNTKSWYYPITGLNVVLTDLSDVEQANANLIRDYTQSHVWPDTLPD